MTLWFFVGVLIVLAVGFCLPLWRGTERARPTAVARDAYNASLYADYEQELAEDHTLDADTKAALLADKARQLIDDTRQDVTRESLATPESNPPFSPTDTEVSPAPQRAGLIIKGASLVLVIGGSLVTYMQLGTPAAEQLAQARDILSLPSVGELVDSPKNAEAVAQTQRLRSLTAGLRDHVDTKADEAGSWYLLGIGELKLGNYSESAAAFEAAHRLVGADANLDLYWLQARLLADKGQLTEPTRAIAQRVLASAPNQPMVLNMLALAAFRSEDFATAVGYLNTALSNNITEGQRKQLAVGFAQARESLGVSGPTVDVALTVAPERPAGAVLFVIARPVGGGMPYAVVRRPANGVPKQVRLDDAVSMNPANPLSAAEEIEIVVRLSLTGRPQAGAGDWQWQSAPLNIGALDGPVTLRADLKPPLQG